jgi:hypothetical protein
MNKVLLTVGAMFLVSLSGFSQCTDWLLPEPPATYPDFSTAPCTGDSIVVENGIPSAIAFQIGDVMAGGTYSFSLCNGPNTGAWAVDFTIIAPSGTIDAFGAGDGCAITWTASESGAYTLIINEEGQCGIQNTNPNGFPTLTTISGGADCPLPAVMIPGAESFEGGVLPECWTIIDADNDEFSWDVLNDADLAFDGDYSMISYSWVDLPLNPDNYLITPKLELGTSDSLYYVVRATDSDFVDESYSVLVSNTGNDLADFTDELFTEVINSSEYQGRSIDLSAYDGQSVYIAFRHYNVSDVFAFNIDAVKLPGTINCNPESVFNPEGLENITIYPNPSAGVFHILNDGDSEQFMIRVFDMTGKIVNTDNVMLNSGSQYQIDLTNYTNGFYTIQFISPTKTGALRVVKK